MVCPRALLLAAVAVRLVDGLVPAQRTTVIVDIDDTIKSSGNVRLLDIPLGGIDGQYDRGAFYPGVFDFVRASPIFSSTGKIAILKNERGCRGVEHVDHRLPDLVSEFVWVRPAWSTKQFFVKDACLRKHVVPPSVRVLWFDDHLPHGIHPVDADAQVSIRVDGVFRPLFREYVCRFGMFGDVGFDGVSLAAVLWAQAPPADDDDG